MSRSSRDNLEEEEITWENTHFGTYTTVDTGALRTFASAARDISSCLGYSYRMKGSGVASHWSR